MKSDPIVDAIRKIRDAHAAQFGYDLKAICDDFRRQQEECGHRVVSLPPKRVAKKH